MFTHKPYMQSLNSKRLPNPIKPIQEKEKTSLKIIV